MSLSPLIVNCAHHAKPGSFFSPHFGDRLRWQFVDANSERPWPWSWLQRGTGLNFARVKGGLETAVRAVRGTASLVVSHDPRVTFACEFFLRRLRFRGPHLAFSFNFPALPTGRKFRLMKSTFQSVDRFVVYSKIEQKLYSESFEIPVGKIDFIHWGVRPPRPDPVDRPVVASDYICALGENARDYRTLISAMAALPHIKLVVVARPFNLAGLTIPPNVEVRTNVPLGEAMNILAFSRFMVLPLAGSEVPCGHVTLVSAMHLGKAFLISNSTGVADYVLPEENAAVCEPYSVDAVVAGIRRLWDDPELCGRLGERGREFATANCSEKSTLQWLTSYLASKQLLSNME